jgi:hypothetical protein
MIPALSSLGKAIRAQLISGVVDDFGAVFVSDARFVSLRRRHRYPQPTQFFRNSKLKL